MDVPKTFLLSFLSCCNSLCGYVLYGDCVIRVPYNFDCVEMGKRAKAKRAAKRAAMRAPKKQRFSKAFLAAMPRGRRPRRERKPMTEGIRPEGSGNKGIRRSRMGAPFLIPDRTESLGDVSGSVAFSNTNYNINPGLVTSFPWLSQLAQAFEYWSCDSIEYDFKSTSGSAIQSASAALGKVVMATDYDVFDSNFTTTQQAENYDGFTRCEVWKNAKHIVLGGNRRVGKLPVTEFKIRPGAVPSGADQSLYDIGNFQFITSGQPSAFLIGELFVTYRGLKFYKPKTSTPLGAAILAGHWAGVPTTSNGGAMAAMVQRSGSNVVATISGGSVEPATITIANPGRYLVCFGAAAATTYTANGGLSESTNVTYPNILDGSTASVVQGASTAQFATIQIVDVNSPNGIITMAKPTTVTGAVTSDLLIVQIPSNLTLGKRSRDGERIDALSLMLKGIQESLRSLGAPVSEDEEEYKRVIEPVELNGRVVGRLTDRIFGSFPDSVSERSASRSSSRDTIKSRA
jgi:hypothetical protein